MSTQTLWIPIRLPGMNDIIAAAKVQAKGGRWNAYADLKRRHTKDIALLAKSLTPVRSAFFTFRWFEPNRRRDPDNLAAGGRKIILDALVKAGVLKNDGWGQVIGWTDDFCCSQNEPGVHVTIQEVLF